MWYKGILLWVNFVHKNSTQIQIFGKFQHLLKILWPLFMGSRHVNLIVRTKIYLLIKDTENRRIFSFSIIFFFSLFYSIPSPRYYTIILLNIQILSVRICIYSNFHFFPPSKSRHMKAIGKCGEMHSKKNWWWKENVSFDPYGKTVYFRLHHFR